MKKIAFYLLFLFSLVQFGPGLKAVFSASNTVISLFNPDEEKNADGEKADQTEKKGKSKEFFETRRNNSAISAAANAYLHWQDAIGAAPLIDILTPPPNQA